MLPPGGRQPTSSGKRVDGLRLQTEITPRLLTLPLSLHINKGRFLLFPRFFKCSPGGCVSVQ